MLKRNILLILLLTINICQAQSLDKDFTWLNENNQGIKQISISKNNKVGIIQCFNQNGKPFFIKNSEFNGDNVFAVWYLHWNKENKNDKMIFAHSNVGFEIEIYSINKNVKETFTYLTKETEDFINEVENVEFNEFQYLEEVKQINDTISLFKSKNYTDLLKRKKYLKEKTVLNNNQQEISSKIYNYKREIESSSSTKYQNNKVIVDYSNNSMGMTDLSTQYFDNEGNLISETNGNNLTKYIYKNKKVSEKLISENKKVISRTIYIYNGDLLIQEIYEDIENGKKYSDEYKYNDKGKLSSKTLNRNDGQNLYKYEYIYW